jgi:phosphate transport system protein
VNTAPHIVRAFDDQLAVLDAKIAEMSGLLEAMLGDALDALAKGDPLLCADAGQKNRKVHDLEGDVNDLAHRLLARRQPMAEDLRAILAAMRVADDLQRAADLAANIARRVAGVAHTPPLPVATGIAAMGAIVAARIRSAVDAYIARDVAAAMQVWNADGPVDQQHGSLFRALLTYMMEDPRKIAVCAHLMFVAKNVERIGDHATNVAERVVFLVTGTLPAAERPKNDTAPFAEASRLRP